MNKLFWRVVGLHGTTLLMTLSVQAQSSRYVNAASTNPVAPYTTWATAARDIQTALDVAAANDTIWVTNGTYASGGRTAPGSALTNRVLIDRRVTLRSVNGPSLTIIHGQSPIGPSAVRGLYLSATGATLAGFTVSQGATLTADAGIPDGDQCGGGAAILTQAGISNCVFSYNQATLDGGGLYCGAKPSIQGCQFLFNQTGRDGGGLNAKSGCTLWNSFFGLNTANGSGGGLYALANSQIWACTNAFNVASNYGGGAYLAYTTISNSTLAANTADVGGGLFLGYGEAHHLNVFDNHAGAWGGGAAINLSELTDSIISNNQLTAEHQIRLWRRGGGVFMQISSLRGCIVSDNETKTEEDYGGGIFGRMTNTIIDCIIRNNRSGYGGGLALGGPEDRLYLQGLPGQGCHLEGNSASNLGGGLFLSTQSLVAATGNVWLHANDCPRGGGGALIDSACFTGINIRVQSNSAQWGGGLYVKHAQAVLDAQFEPGQQGTVNPPVWLTHNQAVLDGAGACLLSNSQLTARNVLVRENQAERGGGVQVDAGSTGIFANAIFVGNQATAAGGGVHVYDVGSRATLLHCTVMLNATSGIETAAGGVAILQSCIVGGHIGVEISPGNSVTNCDVSGGYSGAGNMDMDPSLLNPGYGDLRPTIDSTNSIVDTGIYAGLTNDCTGRVRPIGAGYDMGAFEYHPGRDDTDGDGMADAWEVAHSLNPRSAADGTLDSDGDGALNTAEYLADTNPHNSNSYFRLNDCYYNPARPDRGIQAGFMSSTDRQYSLYTTLCPTNPTWAPVPGQLAVIGAGSYDGLDETNLTGGACFRVTVEPIPQ